MDMQEYLETACKAGRKDSFDKSDQLTLGEIILKLEPIVAKQKEIVLEDCEESKVCYDFGRLFPTSIDSWRGSYAELALNYIASDYGKNNELTVTAFLEMLKEAVGKTFTGYKGGEFTMNKNTPVWVSNHGEGCNTAVIEIVDCGYQVMIITGNREF